MQLLNGICYSIFMIRGRWLNLWNVEIHILSLCQKCIYHQISFRILVVPTTHHSPLVRIKLSVYGNRETSKDRLNCVNRFASIRQCCPLEELRTVSHSKFRSIYQYHKPSKYNQNSIFNRENSIHRSRKRNNTQRNKINFKNHIRLIDSLILFFEVTIVELSSKS